MYATNSLALGIYEQLMFPGLGFYHWSDGTYEGLLADSFGFDADNNYVVTLKSGVTWSDGTPVTSQDVVTTFNTCYLLGRQVWQSISKVEAVDDLTVKFTVTAPSQAAGALDPHREHSPEQRLRTVRGKRCAADRSRRDHR